MLKYILILNLAILFSLSINAQRKAEMHVIELTDKNNSIYNIYQPWEFLSPRAIQRRMKSGIAIQESDLPVNETYVQAIKETGAKIHSSSKWMNSVLVIANKKQIEDISKLGFVKNTIHVGFSRKPKKRKDPFEFPNELYTPLEDRYGFAQLQIKMMLGHIIHLFGYEGEGVLVGVLDGGFTNADVMPFFDSLRVDGRMLPCKDIVHGDDYAYEDSTHGSQVLSTMGANLPGLMVGTAPGASYICIKTEEMGAENPVEEEYWIRGLEYADSLGVDVVNSSLGYTSFDMKKSNHEKSKLDGKTYRGSIAATIAASKGILVVSSAGNEGDGSWEKIGVPADAEDILTIGAVDGAGNKADFSSMGPTADGRIKPEVSAMGERAAVASTRDYGVYGTNGTSFSSPILAGMAATLWSAFPNRSNMEIKESIIASGSQSMKPDSLLGYGIPDFTKAYAFLTGVPFYHNFDLGSRIFKRDDGLQIIFPRSYGRYAHYSVYDSSGILMKKGRQELLFPMGYLEIGGYDKFPNGVYHIVIVSGDHVLRIHDVR